MTSEIVWSRIGEIESRLDDLQRAQGVLNLRVSDLLVIWSMVACRDVPADFGAMKYPTRTGTVKAQVGNGL